jgi:hypothetical protein
MCDELEAGQTPLPASFAVPCLIVEVESRSGSQIIFEVAVSKVTHQRGLYYDNSFDNFTAAILKFSK